MQIDKKYYKLEEAAKILSLSQDDLIHLAAHDAITLHILLPSGLCASPIWRYKTDDPFEKGENLCPVSGFTAEAMAAEISARTWKLFEADPSGAFIDRLKANFDPDSPYQSPPEGIEFCGWDLLDKNWDRCKLMIADCKIVILHEELNRFRSTRGNTPFSFNEATNSETPSQRRARIQKYVNDAFVSGKEKQASYKELAAIEGCGFENIKRIYLEKDKLR